MTTAENGRKIAAVMDNTAIPAPSQATRHRLSRRFIRRPHARALTQALTSDHAEHWGLWPLAMDRIRDFQSRYPCEMDIESFIRTLTAHFVGGSPLARVWIAFDLDGRVVGHLAATIERRSATPPVGFIWQLESDVPLTRRARAEAFSALGQWARECGADALELWTAHNPILWTRTYGFVPHRTIMRRTL